SEKLFALIRRLRSQGVTIIYISHILPEVIALCDRITVLRDGQVVRTIDQRAGDNAGAVGSDPNAPAARVEARPNEGTAPEPPTPGPEPAPLVPPLTEQQLAGLMVGREMADHY